MSRKELVRVEILARVKQEDLTLRDAAELMRVSYRHAKRLAQRYREEGAAGLQHRAAGKSSNRGKPKRFRQKVLKRISEKYSGTESERFGPTLAAEHLEAEDGLKVDAETLRRWMLKAGLWSRRRKGCLHRQRRDRKEHFGELVQMDGSFHDWFEKRGSPGCLINLADDATSTTLSQLGKEETIWAAANALEAWIVEYGIPLALYTDWKNVYVREPSVKEELHGIEPRTAFGAMCERLGIRIIAAGSPQAKGRVERSHGTHQDRLVKKMRLRKICTYAAANEYLEQEYLPEHNRRFSRAAAKPEDYHRRKPSVRELREAFRLEQDRTLSNDWVVRYENRLLQVQRRSRKYALAGAKITVCEWQDGVLELRYRGQKLDWEEIAALPPRPERPSAYQPTGRRRGSKPAANHPWRSAAIGRIAAAVVRAESASASPETRCLTAAPGFAPADPANQTSVRR
jgi:transposase